MPLSENIFETLQANIVPIDVLLFLGLYVLHDWKPIVNLYDGSLVSLKDFWIAELIHELGHLHFERPFGV